MAEQPPYKRPTRVRSPREHQLRKQERRSAMTAHQALVLNADFRPLSYFPLSLLGWQDAVRLVFQDKLIVVAEYDRVVRSPVARDAPAIGRGAAGLRPDAAARRLHALQRLPARPLPLPVLRRGVCVEGSDVRSRRSALAGRRDGWDNVLAACEPCNTRKGKPGGRASAQGAAAADAARAAGGEALLSAELSARKLARLSLLGCRARS